MPVHGDPGAGSESVNYRQKYKTLKKKLKLLVYEQECFLEELRKSQRKLLRVSRDRSFLLDRLMQYEKVEESSGDSDATASSDSEAEKSKELSKKKKTSHGLLSMYSNTGLLGSLATSNLASLSTVAGTMAHPGGSGVSTGEPPKKKQKVTKKVVKLSANTSSASTSQLKQSPTTPTKSQSRSLSREEVERQLELKQSKRPQFMSLEKTPHSLPDDIFSNENSNPDGTSSGNGQSSQNTKDAQNLVIDLQEEAV